MLFIFFFLTWCPSVTSWWLFCNSKFSQISLSFTGNWHLGWFHFFSHYLQMPYHYCLASNTAEEKSNGNGIHWFVDNLLSLVFLFFLDFGTGHSCVSFQILCQDNLLLFLFSSLLNYFNLNDINLSVKSDHSALQFIWERNIEKLIFYSC